KCGGRLRSIGAVDDDEAGVQALGRMAPLRVDVGAVDLVDAGREVDAQGRVGAAHDVGDDPGVLCTADADGVTLAAAVGEEDADVAGGHGVDGQVDGGVVDRDVHDLGGGLCGGGAVAVGGCTAGITAAARAQRENGDDGCPAHAASRYVPGRPESKLQAGQLSAGRRAGR